MGSEVRMMVEDVIIVGAGPAGLAAAIQLKRYGMQVRLFERARAGGLLWNANLVENYPGFPGGIRGTELVELFIQQARNLGVDVTYEDVSQLTYAERSFRVNTNRSSYASKVAVIATGTRACSFKNLTVPEDIRDRVYYEVSDLLELAGKRLVIIGSGDAAFDYALNLGRNNKVTILNRGENPKCLPLLWERVQRVSNITYRNGIEVCKLGKDEEGGILVDCQSVAGALQFHADALVGAIGRDAQLDCLSGAFLQQAGALEEQGILYMIGDVKNGIFRQTSIAAGEGILAAMKIYRHLKEIA